MMKQILWSGLLLLSFLACQQGEGTQSGGEKASLAPSLDSLFQEITVVKMHLFTPDSTAVPADYPYTGSTLDSTHYVYLRDDLRRRVEEQSAEVYACQKVQGDLYVLRLPGEIAPHELVLCRYDAMEDKLMPIRVLAFNWCMEGECQRQDAWLDDLDLDRQLEVIVRGRQMNAEGLILNEIFEVYTQDEESNWIRGKEELANKTSYVLTAL
ncbi:MAG: hypothetical protein AAFP19_12980 [Bacteroidota bacterium]